MQADNYRFALRCAAVTKYPVEQYQGGVTDLQCCLLALPEEPGLPVDMVSPLVSEMEIIFR